MNLLLSKSYFNSLKIKISSVDVESDDLKQLNIDIPEHITPATQYIDQMINFVKGLEEKGFTYKLDDGIYFDIKKTISQL